jgi:hypothetical protein
MIRRASGEGGLIAGLAFPWSAETNRQRDDGEEAERHYKP